jgi:hypothetical protein
MHSAASRRLEERRARQAKRFYVSSDESEEDGTVSVSASVYVSELPLCPSASLFLSAPLSYCLSAELCFSLSFSQVSCPATSLATTPGGSSVRTAGRET